MYDLLKLLLLLLLLFSKIIRQIFFSFVINCSPDLIAEEMEVYKRQYEYHHELMLYQQAEIEERISILGYDLGAIPHRKLLDSLDEKLENSETVVAAERDIVLRKDKSKLKSSNTNDICYDYVDIEEEEYLSNPILFDTSDDIIELIANDEFIQYFDNEVYADVSKNSYPQYFEGVLPKMLLKALYHYHRGLFR